MKLVRDKYVDIIDSKELRIADANEVDDLLRQKLQEEVDEFLESGDVVELCDVWEVLLCLAKRQDVSFEQLNEMRLEKLEKKGSFHDHIVWLGKKN